MLRSYFSQDHWSDVQLTTVVGRARFPSITQWVHTDVRGWTLADKIDDAQFARLAREAETCLQSYVKDGRVEFDSPAHIVTAKKR